MQLPFFKILEHSSRILIAGAGGGFDVFAGLPLFLWLRSRGKEVHLANLSFTDIDLCTGERPCPEILIARPDSSGSHRYFPELHLTTWLHSNGFDTPVHCIGRAGCRQVRAAYRWLSASLKPDTIILVDGGTDILMRGDEAGLGTPQEDISSLAAVAELNEVPNRLLACIGFGVDTFHGVCHAHFLENAAALIREQAFLGSWSLMCDSAEYEGYRAACNFAHSHMPWKKSIVNTSILAGARGCFGDHHETERTEGSTLMINPLMAQYWAFQVDAVARRNLYISQIRETSTFADLSQAIHKAVSNLFRKRSWQELPF